MTITQPRPVTLAEHIASGRVQIGYDFGLDGTDVTEAGDQE